MKALFTLLLALMGHQVFACVCFPMKLMERYIRSDFVATAKIIDIARDGQNEDFHTAEISIATLYKGSAINSLRIYTSLNSSCGFYTPKNTTWLIFASKNNSGDLVFGSCSGSEQVDKTYDSEYFVRKYTEEELIAIRAKRYKTIQQKLEVLQYIKDSDLYPTNEYRLKTYFMDECLWQPRSFTITTPPYAFYELAVDTNLKIKMIKPLKELGNAPLDAALLNCIKEHTILRGPKNKKSIPTDTKLTLCLYFYEGTDTYESFVSSFGP